MNAQGHPASGFWRGQETCQVTPEPLPRFTLPSEQRDFPEWHRGRSRYAVWAIAVDVPEVHHRLALMRDALHPLLLPEYERQPHVTLHVCGFPATERHHADDFTADQLAAHIAAVQRLRLRVGGAFSFLSAPCLSVDDADGRLQPLRESWHTAAHHDQTPYVPHLTAGLYRGAWPLHDIEHRLQHLVHLPALDLKVRHLDWMSYDSRRIGGALRTEVRLDLQEGAVEGLPAAGRASVFSR